MVTLDKKMLIIQQHLTGKSNRGIARDLGLDRKTVNKYVNEFETLQEVLKGVDGNPSLEDIRQATEAIIDAPTYKVRISPQRKWNAEMDEILDGILKQEEEKRIRLKTSKQQLTIKQIHKLMVEKGCDIGYSTVCQKIQERRQIPKEAFIAQTYEYGQRFEYDFGEVRLEIAGSLVKTYLAVMVAPASGYRFAILYRNQRFEAFVDSQVRFFEHMGGCFEEGVYDNMRNVVSKFIGRSEKELNPRLLQLAAYYGFKVNVCNCFAGNEKGCVESSVKTIRNAAFASHWRFDSLAEAQMHLDRVLSSMNKDCPIDEERASLHEKKPAYEIADIRTGAFVDKYSCIRIDKVSYSVPDYLVGKKVLIKAYPNEIVVLSGGVEVARHERSFDSTHMVLDIKHYLATLSKKPGALARSSALSAQKDLKEIFDYSYSENPREFIAILTQCKHLSLEDTLSALKNHRGPASAQTAYMSKDEHIAKQTLSQIQLIANMKGDVA